MKRNWSLVSILTVIILLLTFLFGPNVIDRFKKVKIVYRIDQSKIVLPEGLVKAIRDQRIISGKELPNTIYNITFRNESAKVCVKPTFNIKSAGQIYDFKITDTNEDLEELDEMVIIRERSISFTLGRFGPRSFIACNVWINGELASKPINISASNDFILQPASGESKGDGMPWGQVLFGFFLAIVVTAIVASVVEPALRKLSLLQMKQIRLDELSDANHKSVFVPMDFSFAEWFDRKKIKYSLEFEEVSFLVNILGNDVVSLNPKTKPVSCEILVESKIQALHLLYAYKPKDDGSSVKVVILHDDGSQEIDTLYCRNYLSMVGDVVRVFTLNDSSIKGAVNYEKVSVRHKQKKTSKICLKNNGLGSQFALIALTIQREGVM